MNASCASYLIFDPFLSLRFALNLISLNNLQGDKKMINEKNLNFPRILFLNEQNDPKP